MKLEEYGPGVFQTISESRSGGGLSAFFRAGTGDEVWQVLMHGQSPGHTGVASLLGESKVVQCVYKFGVGGGHVDVCGLVADLPQRGVDQAKRGVMVVGHGRADMCGMVSGACEDVAAWARVSASQ